MPAPRFLSVLSCVLLAIPAAAQDKAAPSGALALLKQIDQGLSEVYTKVAPSVVVVSIEKRPGESSSESFDFFFRSPDDRQKHPPLPEIPGGEEGSGFILREDGVIVTNQHVIEGAEKITVRLQDGRTFPATLLGVDPRTDIAVIKIDAKGLPPVTFGDSNAVRIGQIACAIGAPFSLDYSFTVGVISGKGRSGLSSILTYEDYLQTDAFINPGNSGGPLFDVEGQVIGMNTLINGIGRGLAFAIPSQMIVDVSTQIIETGRVRYPWLGIRMETLQGNSTLREQIQGVEKGVVINTIEPETPAYKSDLRPADVITAVDGQPVATARELQKQILKKKVGQTVNLTIWRGKKSLTIPVTTGELPAPAGTRSTPTPSTGNEAITPSRYGLEFGEIDKSAQKRLKLSDSKGALITKVYPKSPADLAALEVDDVITEIDSKPVTNVAEAKKLLEHRSADKSVLLIVERKGQKTYAVLKFEK